MTREHPHWAGTPSVKWNRETVQGFDVVVIATNHQAVNYQELAAWAQLHRGHAERLGHGGHQARPGLEGLIYIKWF